MLTNPPSSWACLCLLLCVLATPPVLAQDYITENTAQGRSAKRFEKASAYSRSMDFERALRELDRLLEDEPTFVDAWLLRAAIRYDEGRLPEAEADFERALSLAPDYEPITLYRLALTELKQKKYPEAVAHFEAFLATDPRGDRLRERTEQHLSEARFRAEAMSHPVAYAPRSIGDKVNTPDWEYLPSFTADRKYLVYTARRGNQEDLFISERVDGVWQEGQPLDQINTPLSEGAQNISADGRLLVFTACNRRDGLGSCDLYFSAWQGGGWTRPANMGRGVNTGSWESQPSLSADGNALYFASDRRGGLGKRDIWVSHRESGNTWGEPINLGPVINTPDDDESPFIHPDNRTLYFMSRGHPGMGGSDIFYARRDEQGDWGEPRNLGYPINTEGNEGALVVSLDGRTAYFASDRLAQEAPAPGTRPTTDIYAFDLYPQARPEPVTYVKAEVRDQKSGKPLSAVVEFINLDTETTHLRARTGQDGAFLVTLPLGIDYALNVTREGYFFHSENFALSGLNTLDQPFILSIGLRPLPDDAAGEPADEDPIVLRNVFFETGSAALKPASRTELNRLRDLLEENPRLRIQIHGHTDNVGQEADNLTLSEARAAAVREYLIEAGIAPSRLEAAGFGESRPIAPNDTEEGRRRNRRTEFVPLSPADGGP